MFEYVRYIYSFIHFLGKGNRFRGISPRISKEGSYLRCIGSLRCGDKYKIKNSTNRSNIIYMNSFFAVVL